MAHSAHLIYTAAADGSLARIHAGGPGKETGGLAADLAFDFCKTRLTVWSTAGAPAPASGAIWLIAELSAEMDVTGRPGTLMASATLAAFAASLFGGSCVGRFSCALPCSACVAGAAVR